MQGLASLSRDSGAWRCNQRVFTCEFDPVICVCQYGNRVAQSVSGVPNMQLNSFLILSYVNFRCFYDILYTEVLIWNFVY